MQEILSTIFDLLPVPDLARVAQCSRRMKEMIYEESRWIHKLRQIGCWNEAEARLHGDFENTQQPDAQNGLPNHLPRPFLDENGTKATDSRNKSMTTAHLDASPPLEDDKPKLSGPKSVQPERHDRANSKAQSHPSYQSDDSPSALNIVARSRSTRGKARLDYSKIHVALAPFYNDAIRSKQHTNAKVFRHYRDPLQQAQMLSQMNLFAKSDTTQGWMERHSKLADLVAAFEDAVTHEFDQGLDHGDIDGKMRKYAHVLVALNGGSVAVDHFISRNPIIKEKDSLGDPMDCIHFHSQESISLLESQAFFSHVSTAFNGQTVVIDRVFPPSANVILPFLFRIGDEVVGNYLNTLFKKSRQQSSQCFLQAMPGTYEQSLGFAEGLQPSQYSGAEFDESVDKMIAGIYGSHIDTYLEEELLFFKAKSDAEVSGWERQLSEQDATMRSMYMSNVNRQADKRDFLTSFKKVVMMPVNVFPMVSPFNTKSGTAKALVNGDNPQRLEKPPSQGPSRTSTPDQSMASTLTVNRSATPVPEPPTNELAAKAAIMNSRLEGIKSLFSLEIALNLVHLAKSSIERMATFVKSKSHFEITARKQCRKIFVLMLQVLGTRHVKTGFDQAVEHLSEYNAREVGTHTQGVVGPLVIFLELVNVGDLIQQMIDVFFEQELIAKKLTDRNDFLDPAGQEKKRFEQMLDERVAAGLNKGIEVLMSEVEYICATTQKSEDFNPEAASDRSKMVLDIGTSATALQVVELVSSHTKMLIGSTDKNMLDVFNQEVGLRLFTTLCKHLKRQRISVEGSIKLISDMNAYFGYIQTLKNKNLLEYFTALRELSQIYLISPKDAKELATVIADSDRFHGIFRAEEVYEFAERRADWYQIKGKVEKAMYGVGCMLM